MTKTLLLGLDGATFSILDPLLQAGVMPHLQRFIQRGTRAELLSTTPPVTYPAWTSLVTGHYPGQHGVFDFVQGQEMPEGIFVRPVDSRDIQCETIWSMASRQQQSVTSLNFPVMFPPRPLNGFMVPGFVSWRHLRNAVYPPAFYEELRALAGFDAKALAWDMDMETKAVQTMPWNEYEDWIQFHRERQRRWFEILKYLMRTHPCDFTAYLDDMPDKLQHLAWRLIDPALYQPNGSAWEDRIHELCLGCFRQLDAYLGEIIELAGKDTRVFIASDHGFGATAEIFYLNVWLHEHGYLEWGKDRAAADDSEDMFAPRRKSQLYDWSRTLAYGLTPSGNGLAIRIAGAHDDFGIPPQEYESFRRKLAAELLAFTDEFGAAVVERVLTREELFPGDQMARAPDLTLVLRDQGFISALNADAPLKRRKETKGTHNVKGIFIAAGPGIQQGLKASPLKIVDVCPALLYSLGIAIPQGLEGRLPDEIFEHPFLRMHRPVMEAPAQAPLEPLPILPSDTSPEDAAVMERLRALGYIE